jgi:hypothetical protein
MSISSVNVDSHGDCSVWRFEDGELFLVGMGMEEKVPSKEVWDGDGILPLVPRRLRARKL